MEIKLNDIMQKLPQARRDKIEARAAELMAEQMTLRDIRKARELTQERMAELLGIRQDSVIVGSLRLGELAYLTKKI